MKNSKGKLRTPAPVEFQDGRGFGFETADMNTFARAEYMDTFGFYQSRFGLYSHMQMNNLHKFIVHTPKGHPLMIQPQKNCAVTPTGSLTIGQRELTPTNGVIFEKFCWDELLNSCFEHFITWESGGDITLDGNGMAMFQQLVNEMSANAALAWRMSLCSGDLYDAATVGMADDSTANVESLFRRTHGTFQGWMKVAKTMASSGYGWMNQNILTADQFSDAGFDGDILSVYDTLRSNAPKPMRQIINRGGVMRGGRSVFTPLFVVSDSMFNAVINEYNAQANQIATNRVRLTRQEVASAESLTPTVFYMIDDTPIIPLSDISGFDTYVNRETHFAGIIASGNIQLGMSYADIPSNIEDGLAMMFGQRTDAGDDDYGTYWFRSHMLGVASIADPDYFIGTFLETTDQ